jgi:Sulfotransferase family
VIETARSESRVRHRYRISQQIGNPRQEISGLTRDEPFFIVGSGRCGSTLLRLILCSHSRIHIPVETNFIEDLVSRLPLTGSLTPADVELAIKIMTSHRRWPVMGMPAEELRARVGALSAPTLAELINVMYRYQTNLAGKQRFGDKTPHYIRIIPQLITLYPQAKFIHLIRDGRDVAMSFLDAGFERYYDRNKFLWTIAIKMREKYQRCPYAAQILEMRYEDLIADLQNAIRRICEFIGEDFEPDMLDWHKNLMLLPEGWEKQHQKLYQPLLTDGAERWRTIGRVDCFIIESCLHAELRRLGYPLRFAGIAWRPLLALCGWGLRAAAPLLSRGIPHLQRRNYLPEPFIL